MTVGIRAYGVKAYVPDTDVTVSGGAKKYPHEAGYKRGGMGLRPVFAWNAISFVSQEAFHSFLRAAYLAQQITHGLALGGEHRRVGWLQIRDQKLPWLDTERLGELRELHKGRFVFHVQDAAYRPLIDASGGPYLGLRCQFGVCFAQRFKVGTDDF